MKPALKTIGVATTGGDAPGMNAAIRAVVRAGVAYGMRVFGIQRGWTGLANGEIEEMFSRSVSGIINRGGTILHTVRCPEFKRRSFQKKCVDVLSEFEIEGLVIIGGDGSFHAAHELRTHWNIPVAGIPATIDNDISGTDYSIGFDTAINTALDAIDRIRDTAFSHERVFVVEVMGRERGFLALEVGIAGGADVILIPEIKMPLPQILKTLREKKLEGRKSFVVVTAEGAWPAEDLSQKLRRATGFETRVSVLGHLQRGGAPTAFSRILASHLGVAAVKKLAEGEKDIMVGMISNKVVSTPLSSTWTNKKKIDKDLYKLISVLEG